MACRISTMLAVTGFLAVVSAGGARAQDPMPNPQAMQLQVQQIVQQRPREAEAAARAFLHVISMQEDMGSVEPRLQALEALKTRDPEAYWHEVAQLTVQFDMVQNLVRRDSTRAGLVTRMFGLEAMARTLQQAYRTANEAQRTAFRKQLETLIAGRFDLENQLRLLEIKDIERRLAEVRGETQRRIQNKGEFVRWAVEDIIRDATRPR